jgi:hypothetical protein
VPVFEIAADMVDASRWSHEDMVGAVSRFLIERVEAKRA